MYWRYDLNAHLTELLSNKRVTKGVDAFTINLIELCGMVMTAYVAQVILEDKAKNARRSSTVEGGHCSSFVD